MAGAPGAGADVAAQQRAEEMEDEDPTPFIEGPVVTVSASIPRLLEDLLGWLGVVFLATAAYLYVGLAGAFAVAGIVALAFAVLLEVSD